MRILKLFGVEIMVPNEGEDEMPRLPPPPAQQPCAIQQTIEHIPFQQPCAISQTIQRMKGSRLVLVMTKTLTRSDLNPQQGRLLITSKVLWGQLLEEEERRVKANEYVEVEVVDPRGERNEMKLRFWDSVKTFVLNSGWTELARDNELEAGVEYRVQLWSFRMGLKLCFALHVERQN